MLVGLTLFVFHDKGIRGTFTLLLVDDVLCLSPGIVFMFSTESWSSCHVMKMKIFARRTLCGQRGGHLGPNLYKTWMNRFRLVPMYEAEIGE